MHIHGTEQKSVGEEALSRCMHGGADWFCRRHLPANQTRAHLQDYLCPWRARSVSNVDIITLSTSIVAWPHLCTLLRGIGSGKGTQCSMLANNYGISHFSAGDLLREERASGSKEAGMINQYIRDGLIVPAGVMLVLMKWCRDYDADS